MKETLYRYHPNTGIDAEDFSATLDALDSETREKSVIELADMCRNGATFWWRKRDAGTWEKIERTNYQFIATATGIELIFDNNKPAVLES